MRKENGILATSALIWQVANKEADNQDSVLASCTHEVVHNVGFTNPDKLTDRTVGNIYGCVHCIIMCTCMTFSILKPYFWLGLCTKNKVNILYFPI